TTLLFTTFTSAGSASDGTPEEPLAGDLVGSNTRLILSSRYANFGQKVKVEVRVESLGPTPTGTVQIFDGDKAIATDTLWTRFSSGKVDVALPRDVAVGLHRLTAVYSGNDEVATSTSEVETLNMLRKSPKITVKTKSWKVKKGTKPKLKVTVSGFKGGPHPLGTALVRVGGWHDKIGLRDGKASYTLPKITKKTRIKVIYYPKKAGYTKVSKYYTFTIKK